MTGGVEAIFRALSAEAADAVTVPDLGRALSDELGRIVPHDGYMLAGLDPLNRASCLFTEEHDYSEAAARRMALDDAAGAERHPFERLVAGPAKVGVVRAGYRHRVRLHNVSVPEGFGSEMRIGLTHARVAWGGLILVRERGSRPFSAAEAAHAQTLAEPLAAALKRFVASAPLRPSRYSLSPGVAVVGADDKVASATPSAHEWMRLLAPAATSVDERDLTATVWNIAHLARRAGGHALSRVPTRDGWIALHGQLLEGPEAGAVAVTIQPAPGRLLLPAVSVWYGITTRERTVMQEVLQGLPTKHIARRLDLSPHTVNDHLKAIYRKTGVNSREELLTGLA
ncbi:LuxR family transcriptional regulator [Streptomyces sp. BPTC-684]|uniref:helix-turn-helix transcriptional regulator n=1 Tax=Streptomyces sp. BPTC-684 TaxID=3043734 RepID=UPI0024B13575|nr:LuxR family transcriptional regulator [Streptomyces sp. BPTC-684]WHM40305.1 LuxR family transcriptional regulator [Streptomyces sp. BPTC-684]